MDRRTDVLASWFSRSRVRGQDRSPLVVWHATAADFESFDIAASKDIGIHFGTREQAEIRVKTKRSPRFIPALLSIANPLVLKEDPRTWVPNYMASATEPAIGVEAAEDFRRRIAERLAEDHATFAAWKEANAGNAATLRKSDKVWDEMQAVATRDLMAILRDLLEERGYDGIAYPNLYERASVHKSDLVEHSWVAFRPEQIRILPDDGLSPDIGARLAVTPGEPGPDAVRWVPGNRVRASTFGDPNDPVMPLVRTTIELPQPVQDRFRAMCLDRFGALGLHIDNPQRPSLLLSEDGRLRVCLDQYGRVLWSPADRWGGMPPAYDPNAGSHWWPPQTSCSDFVETVALRLEACLRRLEVCPDADIGEEAPAPTL